MRAEELLPDNINSGEFQGVTVRKGTVGAFLINAKTWKNPEATAADREQAQTLMQEAVPALYALGVLDIFEARDPALQSLIEQHRTGA